MNPMQQQQHANETAVAGSDYGSDLDLEDELALTSIAYPLASNMSLMQQQQNANETADMESNYSSDLDSEDELAMTAILVRAESQHLSLRKTQQVQQQRQTIAELPVEIQLMLFHELHSVEDAFRLSSTCRPLRSLFVNEIEAVTNPKLRRTFPCYDEFDTVARVITGIYDILANRAPELATDEAASLSGTPLGFNNCKDFAVPAIFNHIRRKLRLIWQCDVAVDVVTEGWRNRFNGCDCYTRQEMYSPAMEHKCVSRAVLFYWLCTWSFAARSLGENLHIQFQKAAALTSLPYLDAQFLYEIALTLEDGRFQRLPRAEEETLDALIGFLDACLFEGKGRGTSQWEQGGQVLRQLKQGQERSCVCSLQAFVVAKRLVTCEWQPAFEATASVASGDRTSGKVIKGYPRGRLIIRLFHT